MDRRLTVNLVKLRFSIFFGVVCGRDLREFEFEFDKMTASMQRHKCTNEVINFFTVERPIKALHII